MEAIGLAISWIIAGVVAWQLAAPVGLIRYLPYQAWFGDISDDDEL
jgi:hypothetical protein